MPTTESRYWKIKYGHQAAILKVTSLKINRHLPIATNNMHIKIPKQTWVMLRKPCHLRTDGQTDRQTDKVNPGRQVPSEDGDLETGPRTWWTSQGRWSSLIAIMYSFWWLHIYSGGQTSLKLNLTLKVIFNTVQLQWCYRLLATRFAAYPGCRWAHLSKRSAFYVDWNSLHGIYFVGKTYNRVYIWCCKYGENRYCERCANK